MSWHCEECGSAEMGAHTVECSKGEPWSPSPADLAVILRGLSPDEFREVLAGLYESFSSNNERVEWLKELGRNIPLQRSQARAMLRQFGDYSTWVPNDSRDRLGR